MRKRLDKEYALKQQDEDYKKIKGRYELKCGLCGRVKRSKYQHDICECGGSMHYKEEKSLLQALEDKDKKTENKIMKAMKSGEIVRLI